MRVKPRHSTLERQHTKTPPHVTRCSHIHPRILNGLHTRPGVAVQKQIVVAGVSGVKHRRTIRNGEET
jgi:hypothetical protein